MESSYKNTMRNALQNKYKINKMNENTTIVNQVTEAAFTQDGIWK